MKELPLYPTVLRSDAELLPDLVVSCMMERLLAYQIAAGDECEARCRSVRVIAVALCCDDVAECTGRSPRARAVQRACRRNREQ